MKPALHRPFLALIGTLFFAGVCPAEIIFKETFDYPEGTKLAECTNAGAPWIVDAHLTSAIVTKEGLKLGDGTANPSDTPASLLKGTKHSIPKYSGDVVYVKFAFSAGPGTTLDPDRFGLFLPSYEPGALLLGTGLTGSGNEVPSNALSARAYDTQSNRITSPVSLHDGTPCVIIAEWSKSIGGPDSPYDRLRMWVNPTADETDRPAPKELTFKTLRTAFTQVGLYLSATEPGDVYFVRNITIATSLADVLSP